MAEYEYYRNCTGSLRQFNNNCVGQSEVTETFYYTSKQWNVPHPPDKWIILWRKLTWSTYRRIVHESWHTSKGNFDLLRLQLRAGMWKGQINRWRVLSVSCVWVRDANRRLFSDMLRTTSVQMCQLRPSPTPAYRGMDLIYKMELCILLSTYSIQLKLATGGRNRYPDHKYSAKHAYSAVT